MNYDDSICKSLIVDILRDGLEPHYKRMCDLIDTALTASAIEIEREDLITLLLILSVYNIEDITVMEKIMVLTAQEIQHRASLLNVTKATGLNGAFLFED